MGKSLKNTNKHEKKVQEKPIFNFDNKENASINANTKKESTYL